MPVMVIDSISLSSKVSSLLRGSNSIPSSFRAPGGALTPRSKAGVGRAMREKNKT